MESFTKWLGETLAGISYPSGRVFRLFSIRRATLVACTVLQNGSSVDSLVPWREMIGLRRDRGIRFGMDESWQKRSRGSSRGGLSNGAYSAILRYCDD